MSEWLKENTFGIIFGSICVGFVALVIWAIVTGTQKTNQQNNCFNLNRGCTAEQVQDKKQRAEENALYAKKAAAKNVIAERIFLECLKSAPAGPNVTKYNDWDELVDACEDAADEFSEHRAETGE